MQHPRLTRVLSARTWIDRVFALRHRIAAPAGLSGARPRHSTKLRLEALEDRVVPATVSLDPPLTLLAEGTTGGIQLRREEGQASEALTVNLAIGPNGGGDPLAEWYADYSLTGPGSLSEAGGSVTFDPGQTAVNLSLSVSTDDLDEETEGFRLTVLPGSGYEPGGSGSTTTDVRIYDAPVLWIEPDIDVFIKGEPATFYVVGDVDAVALVAWDFDYDGQTFQADPGATGGYATETFDTTGPRTVAARVISSFDSVQLLTFDLTVEYPPPSLNVPDDMTVTAGETVTLPVTGEVEAGIESVEWWVSYYYGDYEPDPELTTLSPEYSFEDYGEYDFWVTVTDTNGEIDEVGFHVTAKNEPPEGRVTYVGPDGGVNETFAEGADVTFTVRDLETELDLSNIEALSVYADWYGTGEFEQVSQGALGNYEWVFDESDWSISFRHYYDDGLAAGASYPAAVRVEDDWGSSTLDVVAVQARNVAPTATLSAGAHIATMASSGQEVWAIADGQMLAFPDAYDPSEEDWEELTYRWEISGLGTLPNSAEVSLPAYVPGSIYSAVAYVTDDDGGQSTRYEFTLVVIDSNPPPGPPIGGQIGSEDYLATPAEDEYGTPVGYGALPGAVYGKLLPAGVSPAPYNRYAYMPVVKMALATDTPLDVAFQFDAASEAFLAATGSTPRFKFTIDVYDVERFSIGPDNHDLLTHQLIINTEGTLAGLGGWPLDRMVVVTVFAQFMKDGQVFRQSPPYQVIAETPKSPTTIEQVTDLFRIIRELAPQFGDRADQLIDAVTEDVDAFLDTFRDGLTAAVEDFLTNIRTYSATAFYQWLASAAPEMPSFNYNFANADEVLAFLMNYAGLTWDNVQSLVLQELGEGNVAALTALADRFFGAADGTELETSDPRTILAFLDRLGSAGDLIAGLDAAALKAQVTTAVTDNIGLALARAVPQAAALFVPVPGLGAVRAIHKGLTWLLDNRTQLAGVFTKFLEGIDALEAYSAEAFKAKMLEGMRLAAPAFIGLLAAQFGLSRLPTELSKATQVVPEAVEKGLRGAVRKLALNLGGGTAVGVFNGRLTARRTPSETFEYRGKNYVLFAAKDSEGTKVKIVERGANGDRLVKVLDSADFSTLQAKANLGNYQSLASRIAEAAYLKKKGKVTAEKQRFTDLKALQAQVALAGEAVIQDIRANACVVLNVGCFAAGTRLFTPDGWRNVEDIRPGELVYARDEYDPSGPVEPKAVEETFQRTGCILHLHAGGQIIRTTPEHPFYVEGKGWTAAGALVAGDRIATLSGEWVAVEEPFDTGEYEPVYNVRVAEFHTYFVGDDHWGFAAWTHNTYETLNINGTINTLVQQQGGPGGKGFSSEARRTYERTWWASTAYLREHIRALLGKYYPTLGAAAADQIAECAAAKFIQEERQVDPATAAFVPQDATDFRPTSFTVPQELEGIANRQYTLSNSWLRVDKLKPVVANLNYGGWEVLLGNQLGDTKRRKARGVYILRHPETGKIYKVGKADSGLVGRLERYAKDWVAQGIPVRAEVYKLPGDVLTAEMVLRDRVVTQDGWAIDPTSGGADGTPTQVRPQGTGGWTVGTLP